MLSCTDCSNIRPVGNIALAQVVVSYSNDGSICFQADRVIAASANRCNVRPIRNIASAIIVIARSKHSPIRFQADRIEESCIDCHKIRPVGNIALPILIIADGDCSTVLFQRNDMIVFRNNCRIVGSSQRKAPLQCVLISSYFSKRNGGFCGFSLRQKLLGFYVRAVLRTLCRVLVAAQRFERLRSTVVISVCKQRFRISICLCVSGLLFGSFFGKTLVFLLFFDLRDSLCRVLVIA